MYDLQKLQFTQKRNKYRDEEGTNETLNEGELEYTQGPDVRQQKVD